MFSDHRIGLGVYFYFILLVDYGWITVGFWWAVVDLLEVEAALAIVSISFPQAPWLASDHGLEGHGRIPSWERQKSPRTVSGFKLAESISSGERLTGSSDVRRPKRTSICACGSLLAGRRRCPPNFGALRNNISPNPLSCPQLQSRRGSSSSGGQQGSGDCCNYCCCCASSEVGEEGPMTVSLAEIAVGKGELRVHGEPLLSDVPSNVVFTGDGESSHSGFLGASFPESSSHHVVSLGVLQ